MLEGEPEYRDLQVCRTKRVGQHTEKLRRETTGEANHIWGSWQMKPAVQSTGKQAGDKEQCDPCSWNFMRNGDQNRK